MEETGAAPEDADDVEDCATVGDFFNVDVNVADGAVGGFLTTFAVEGRVGIEPIRDTPN